MKSFFVQKDAIRPRDRGKGGDLVFARVLQLHCSLFPSALRLSLQQHRKHADAGLDETS